MKINALMMIKATTQSIEVCVECKYLAGQSSPKENLYFFVYFITIINNGSNTVQLLKRHWDIVDSNGDKRTVDGDGVVGETPVIEPGESYTYNSGCNFLTEIGYMKGYYLMKRMIDGMEFKIEIPKFNLVVPAKLN